eukprot:sb/3478054/
MLIYEVITKLQQLQQLHPVSRCKPQLSTLSIYLFDLVPFYRCLSSILLNCPPFSFLIHPLSRVLLFFPLCVCAKTGMMRVQGMFQVPRVIAQPLIRLTNNYSH